MLHATNISFAYGNRPALRDVSIKLAPGEIVAILGPNGSGKSTLIRALLGELRPSSGAIAWDEKPIESWRRRDLAKRVAYLPQSPTADPEQTVREVMRLGRAPYWGAFGIESIRDGEVVERIADRLMLNDLLDRPMAELSGGQRQRAFVGRCLAQEPAALLLDEPSTHLDLRHQVDVLRLLRSLADEQGIGVLLASHDLTLAGAFAARLVLMSGGAVAAEGSPADVLQSQILSTVFELEMETMARGSAREGGVDSARSGIVVVPRL